MEQIIEIPLRKLRESPVNPRKTFNEASLRELADTMMPPMGRVHQAIVVRPLMQTDVEADFEIVFGHRRYRAAGLAGLDTIPAVVRDMDDKEVAVAQGVENLQREDVTPIEEADNFNLLRHQHGMSIEELMQRSGKGRTYVFNSLKLATAHDAVRQAVTDRVIGAEIAKELARIPNPLQPRALEMVTKPDYDGESSKRTALPFRQAKNILQANFQLSLLTAPFDTLSIKLVPGVLACDACPKRSDNEPALLDQCGPDVCTDPDCFGSKKEAHVAQIVAAARKRGQPIVEGEDALKVLPSQYTNYPHGYTPVHTAPHWLNTATDGEDFTLADAIGKLGRKAPKTTIVVDPHQRGRYIECLTPDQVEEVKRALGVPPPEPDDDNEDEDASLSVEEQAVSGRDTWMAVRREIVMRAAKGPRTLDELRLVARAVFGDCDMDDDVLDVLGWRETYDSLEWADRSDWVQARIDAMDAEELARFSVLHAITCFPWVFERGAERQAKLALAKLYDVDVLNPTAAQSAESAPPPSTAAQAPEGAPPKAKKVKAKKVAPVSHELDLDDPAAPAGEEGKEEVKDNAGVAGELAAEGVGA